MTPYIQTLRTRFIVNREHRLLRQNTDASEELAKQFCRQQLPDTTRSAERLAYILKKEIPVVYPDEKIACLRTVPVIDEIYTKEEWEKITEKYYIHEQGKVCNITPDYSLLLSCGLDQVLEKIQAELQSPSLSEPEILELKSMKTVLLAILEFSERYRQEAEHVGNSIVAESLRVVPHKPPESFLQALQFLRLIHFALWCSFNYHNTFGRFDQYMYPYLENDLQNGLSKSEALEQLEEFFLSCNKDSDLYPGMQQGDNGQSIVLGGLNPDGTESFNLLSELCLDACEDLRLIDPKINLRVNKNTPLSVYERGTRLTRLGLGFPQYSNDDVVIPCLLHWGYAPEDAYNYSVAACWEFIIPGKAMDIPNINGLSFMHAFQEAFQNLEQYSNYEEFELAVQESIGKHANHLMSQVGEIYMEPAPLMSLMMEGCLEHHQDISYGSIYNNYGLHGTGLATAVDSLAAIREFLFRQKKYSAREIIRFVDTDYENAPEALHDFRFDAPKFGNDDDETDAIAVRLLDTFADALAGHKNSRGGIWRAGTGSAMYYIWHSKEESATPDGRRKGEGLACNYSPSLFARCRGPVSIVKSFSKPHLERVANGGPLTIELHDSVFRNEESITKVACFVKSFMDLGGHQMQINAVNIDTLRDAKIHPENYRNLIVRVWGWSGYFVELDECYQDHIMERMELQI